MSKGIQRKPSRPNSRDLARYEAFALAYLAVGQPTYFNAQRSAEAAGYGRGYCRAKAYLLLGRVGVQDAMRRLRDERTKRSTIASPEEILEILTAQLRTTPEVFVDEKGAIVPLKAGEKDRAQAIAGIKEKTRTNQAGEDTVVERTLEYRLIDRVRVAEILAKHHGLFLKDNEQQKPDVALQLVAMPTGPITLEEWTQQAQVILGKRKSAAPAWADAIHSKA